MPPPAAADEGANDHDRQKAIKLMYFGHAVLDPEECAKNLKSALKMGCEKGYTVRKIIFSHENNSLVECLAIQFAQNPLSTKVELGIIAALTCQPNSSATEF